MRSRTQDAAWVRIATGLSPAALAAFCQDAERLLRINSMYEFEEWRPEGEDRFFMRVRNLGNGRTIETPDTRAAAPGRPADRLRGRPEDGDRVRAEPPPGTGERGETGAILVVTDDYSGTPEAERQARPEEIDQSLVSWGHDLHRYLRHWARWSGFAPGAGTCAASGSR